MTYFNNVKSYEDLKNQYRTLALANHPDMGGDTETMQEINKEYDSLFPVWKHRSAINNNETAASTRSEYYTQNGWTGSRYNRNMSLKEIAVAIRDFIKIHFNDCKFSVTTSYASMCQELHITLMESPHRAYKFFDELTEDEKQKIRQDYTREHNINNYFVNEINAKIAEIYSERYSNSYYTEEVKAIVHAVQDYANSFNYDDSDGMIDYFDTNFYFFGVTLGKWDKPFKVVDRKKTTVANVEYETVEVTKTRTKKVLEPKAIEAPAEIKEGQYFQLLTGFNYGCYKGSVYQITHINGTFVNSCKMGKGYKNVTGGTVRGTSFNCDIDRLKAFVAKGSIAFVELVEVTKTEEYTSTTRRPKKSTGLSTEVKEPSDTTERTAETATTEPRPYTVTEDTDTRDNSALWVVKFSDRMSKEEYQATAATIKAIKGIYSRFKKGFIFRYDPTEEMNCIFNNVNSDGSANTDENMQLIADCIEDASTEIIEKLNLQPGEFVINFEYKEHLTAYIKENKKRITKKVIEKIDIAELRKVVAGILAAIGTTTIQKPPKTDIKTKTQEKISKQIESLTAKIKALSGDYKTNTYKRMQEQASREKTKEGYNFEVDLLIYLYGISEQRKLTILEQNLLVDAFRDRLHGYYNRHKEWMETPPEKRCIAWMPISYPKTSSTAAEWYNKDVPKQQKQLNKAEIYNTKQLIKAVEKYGEIVKEAVKPIDRTAQEIKRREKECKLQQKGDVQFTHLEVARQLVELAGIDENSRVLEPSAGIGNIADQIRTVTKNIDVIEQMSNFRELLQLKDYNLVGYDFLEYQPEKSYTHILMNPPFSKNQDIQHLKHAYSMLENGGTLVCIISPHWSFANDKESINFRLWLDEQDYYTEDLQAKTFEMTGVTSKIIVINKRVEQQENIA